MFEIYPSTIHLITTWIFLYFIFAGIGFWVQRLMGITEKRFEHFLFAFWIGWAVTIAFLQIWHLFFPVNVFVSLIVCGIGLSGILVNRHNLINILKQLHNYRILIIVLIFGMIWLAGQVINNKPHYDDGLYHIQDVEWVTSYSIVPGLGNLHGRFAFNNALSLYFGLIDTLPLIAPVRHVGNSLLMLAFMLLALWSGWQVINRRTDQLKCHLYLLLLPMTMLVSVAYVASIKNDFAIYLLSVILGGLLLDLLQYDTKPGLYQVVLIGLLAFVGSTIKLSIAVFAGGVLLVVLWRNWRILGYVVGLCVVICGVWLLRGVILSGYPIYPVSAVSVAVDWRLPTEIVENEMRWIRSWARQPRASPDEVLASWDWFDTWWRNNVEFMFPIILGIGMFFTFWTRIRSYNRVRLRLWIGWGIVFISLLYWFYSAPDIRFGIHLFWLFGMMSFLITLWHFQHNFHFWVIGLMILLMANAMIQTYWATYQGTKNQFPAYQDVEFDTFYSAHGVRLTVPPVQTDQCWTAELPCTPYPNPYIALRNPDDLGDGFVTRPIESDLGAFYAWYELTEDSDITPSYERGNQLPVNGILIGSGWHSLEVYGLDKQRWVDTGAEIFITEPDLTQQTLCLDVEPGPSVQSEDVELRVMEGEETVGLYQFNEARQLQINLPIRDERVQKFTLVVENDSVPAPNDGRILNFRVTRIDWCDLAP
ncbi:MAG: hypothetical protein Kow00117_07290 [Phototrophicales bacterium]